MREGGAARACPPPLFHLYNVDLFRRKEDAKMGGRQSQAAGQTRVFCSEVARSPSPARNIMTAGAASRQASAGRG